MVKYEVYEKGWQLYLCILDDSGECKNIYTFYDCSPAGILRDCIELFEKFDMNAESVYEAFGPDFVDIQLKEGVFASAYTEYTNGLGDLIASNGFISKNMGPAGRKVFGLDK